MQLRNVVPGPASISFVFDPPWLARSSILRLQTRTLHLPTLILKLLLLLLCVGLLALALFLRATLRSSGREIGAVFDGLELLLPRTQGIPGSPEVAFKLSDGISVELPFDIGSDGTSSFINRSTSCSAIASATAARFICICRSISSADVWAKADPADGTNATITTNPSNKT